MRWYQIEDNAWAVSGVNNNIGMPSTTCLLYVSSPHWVNTSRPRRNGQHYADDIFRHIFVNENIWISIKISLKFIPEGPFTNIPALVQIMAWHRPGDKPLFVSMMVNLPTFICVTLPQWVKMTPYCLWEYSHLILYHIDLSMHINQYWKWLGVVQVASQYLNQCLPHVWPIKP